MSAVGNVARVRRLFTPERSLLSGTEVAQLLGLPRSSTSRRHRAHSTLSVLADEALARIARSTGHTGYVAILDGKDILGLRMRPGSKPLRVVTSPGDRLPAFCSSSGRTHLARLNDEYWTAPRFAGFAALSWNEAA